MAVSWLVPATWIGFITQNYRGHKNEMRIELVRNHVIMWLDSFAPRLWESMFEFSSQ